MQAGNKSLGWEDFAQGREISTPAITLTETHLVQFTGLSGDFYPVHTDEEFARKTVFGKRIAHGPLIFAMAVGLMQQTQAFGGAVIALLEVERLRATAPVFIGDTIRVIATVNEARATKEGSRGVVKLTYSVRNQRDEEVMTFLYALLLCSSASMS